MRRAFELKRSLYTYTVRYTLLKVLSRVSLLSACVCSDLLLFLQRERREEEAQKVKKSSRSFVRPMFRRNETKFFTQHSFFEAKKTLLDAR